MEVALDFEVVVGLDVDPEPVVDPEGLREPECGIGGDGALAADDLADPGLGESGGLGKAVLRVAQWLQELREVAVVEDCIDPVLWA